MKKLLGISLVAVLAATPLMAFGEAANVDKDPGETNASAPVAANAPKYSLAAADATDSNAASAGYVKGAYNAAIKAINKVSEANATSAGDGIAKDANGVISVDYEANKGLDWGEADQVTGHKKLTIKTGNGVEADNTGLKVKGSTAIDVSASGVAVKYDNSTVGVNGSNQLVVKEGGITTTEIANGTIVVEDVNNTALSKGTGANAENTKLTTQGYVDEAISGLSIGDYATKAGVDKTIKAVTLNQGAVTQGLTGNISGTKTTIASIMTEWGSTTSKTDVEAITAVGNGDLATNVSVAAPTINAASVSYTAANTTTPSTEP